MLDVLIEYGCYGPRSKPVVGELWRASSYDRETDKRPAGSGDTPWEALAWWFVSVEETKRGIIAMARNTNDTPSEALARLTSTALLRAAVAARSSTLPDHGNDLVDAPSGGGATFSLAPSQPKSAAARRARTKNARKK